MSETKPVVPLTSVEVYKRMNDVEYSRSNREAWGAHQSWLRACHERHCFEQYATSLTAEQAALVYSQAWEDGHSNGFGDVESQYSDLVVLVEKVLAL